jgi:hypothetical protein
MSEVRVVTVKLPEDINQEMALRIPEGDRSSSPRSHKREVAVKTPNPDTLLELQQRMVALKKSLGKSANT